MRLMRLLTLTCKWEKAVVQESLHFIYSVFHFLYESRKLGYLFLPEPQYYCRVAWIAWPLNTCRIIVYPLNISPFCEVVFGIKWVLMDTVYSHYIYTLYEILSVYFSLIFFATGQYFLRFYWILSLHHTVSVVN